MKEESKGAGEAEWPAWANDAETVLEYFDVDVEEGLGDAQVAQLQERYGPNELQEEENSTLLEKVIEQFDDPLVKIVLGSAAVSFVLA